MKKLIISAVLLAGFPAVAHAQEETGSPWSGLYFGIEGGVDNYELSAEGDLGLVDPELSGLDASFDGLSGDGVAGNVYVGYHLGMESAFLAVEGFVGISSASMGVTVTDGVDTIGLTAEAKESYGGAARLGFKVSRGTAVYGRVGWINTNFETTLDLGTDSISVSEEEDAIQYGAGLETMVGRKVSLRAEYVISDYGDAGLGEGLSLDNGSFKAGLTFRY